MQPTYLPWLGYFELIISSEVFIFFDDVQFEKKSWQQRNRIKTPNGELMLVVPVKTSGARFQKINETLIDNSDNWKRKHLKSIEVNYRKAPYFDKYFPKLEKIYAKDFEKLIDLNSEIIKFVLDELRVKTKLVYSSEIKARSGRDEKIIDICKGVGADELYDAAGAEEILDKTKYDEIKLVFQDYKHPVYNQLHGDFVPYMSVIDLLFNEGEKSLEIIKSGVK
jgi:hypothetical protein